MAISINQGGSVVSSTNPLYVQEAEAHAFAGTFAVSRNTVIVAGAQNGTTTGSVWLSNPATNSNMLKIERINVVTNHAAALSTPTAPIITASRYSFTGTPTGAVLVPCAMDTEYLNATADVRSAYTGMTVSLVGGTIFTAMAVSSQGTAGWAVSSPSSFTWIPRESDYEMVLRPGQGLVVYQLTAGTTSDTRVLGIDITWEEKVL